MSEHPEQTDGGAERSATGHESVDSVLETLLGLDDRPVSEHVSVFEAAHESLRSALARASEPEPGRSAAGPSGPSGY